MAKNRVVVVDEEARKNVKRFASIEAAEQWIAKQEKVEPEKVHRGGYGIDYPEDMDAAYQARRQAEAV